MKTWSLSYLQVGTKVLCDVGTVTLTEYCDLLLDILNLILSLLQINGLYGNNTLSTIINTFKHLKRTKEITVNLCLTSANDIFRLKLGTLQATHLSKRSLSNTFQFDEQLLWINERLREDKKTD